MKLSSLKSDLKKEEEGVWVDYAPGVRLRIARMNNRAYNAFLRKEGKPHRQRIRQGMFSDDELEELNKAACAEHILLDWEGFTEDDGSPLPYTPELGREIFEDEQYRELFIFVVGAASDRALYRDIEAEDIKGNSSGASSGSSNGAASGKMEKEAKTA